MDRIARIREMLVKTPGDDFLQHALALEYVKNGDDAAAKTMFEQILINNPGYIGSYYHLGKLLERTGDTQAAIQWYEKGMAAAKAAADQHALNELRAAHEDLVF
ncbi:MAG TPA: tetratricopeptide repeat protein [Chitinophagaceae bacterium]|nr:tetratricopeptide repeat protein [Chitinophagaceae bacterium]